MCDFKRLMTVIEEIAPLELSRKMVENGGYDNSGVIIKCHDNAEGILFALDLTEKAVEKAVELGMDTIITHHPAIYTPVKSLSVDDKATSALVAAIRVGLNVISCHLNLDAAKGGIDERMMEALGGSSPIVFEKLGELTGYGREYAVEELTLGELASRAKENFKTDKVVVYGDLSKKVKTVASFCGAGASYAGEAQADVVVTSDMPHHVIKELVERGKFILLLPHYASESYGFKWFYDSVTERLGGVKTYYLEDKRFL